MLSGVPTMAQLMHTEVLAQVQDKTDIAAAEQRLIFKGQVLKVSARRVTLWLRSL